jgi:peptidoglycan/xylan/chitin deacetylase (PgdA/CDA1 family)
MNYKILFPGFKERALTFSYDDGIRQDLTLVPLLKKYGFKGTFNLNSGKSGEEKFRTDIEGKEIDCSHLVLKDHVHLYDGMEVASHTYDHPFMNHLPYKEQYEEYKKDIEGLEKLFPTEIRGGAYPFGTYNEDTFRAEKENGLVYSRTTRSTYAFHRPYDYLLWHPTIHHNDPRLMETIDRFFLDEEELPILYIWGHAYEFALQHNFGIIDQIGEKMEGRDDVWYATNYEIYEYCTKAEKVLYYLNRDLKKHLFVNHSDLDVYVRTENGDRLLLKKGSVTPYECE